MFSEEAKTSPLGTSREEDISPTIYFEAPKFMEYNVEMWFILLEISFSAYGIESQLRRFNILIKSLPSETLRTVSYAIRNPPAESEYDHLKECLLREYRSHLKLKIIALLDGCELGDRKPSVLLREMRELSDKQSASVPDELILAIFLKRLPEQMRRILTAGNCSTPEQAAEMADKMWELQFPNCTVSNPQNEITSLLKEIISPLKKITSFMKEITERVSTLEIQMKQLQRKIRSSSRSCSRSRGRTRQEATNRQQMCYYHSQFGARARSCREPCSFFK